MVCTLFRRWLASPWWAVLGPAMVLAGCHRVSVSNRLPGDGSRPDGPPSGRDTGGTSERAARDTARGDSEDGASAGVCFAAGAINPTNGCQKCEPTIAPDRWTLFRGPQCVTTLAGDGTAGFSDGPAAKAKLSSPNGVIACNQVYVADRNNHKVRLITP